MTCMKNLSVVRKRCWSRSKKIWVVIVMGIKKYKRFLLIPLDVLVIVLAYVFTLFFVHPEQLSFGAVMGISDKILTAVIVYAVMFSFFGVYRILPRLAGASEYFKMFFVSLASCIVCVFLNQIRTADGHFEFDFVSVVFIIFACIGYRAFYRVLSEKLDAKNASTELNPVSHQKKRVLIVGAGRAGNIIANELMSIHKEQYKIVGFIDDDISKLNGVISGIKVLGTRNDIKDLCLKHNVDEIIIAMPSVKSLEKTDIIKICTETSCPVRIMPEISLMVTEDARSTLRPVKIEDLLERDPVHLDNAGIAEYITGKTVLVTGVGSIGSELCRQIAEFSPKKLVMLDIYENNAYYIEQELNYDYPELDKEAVIASVRDKFRLDQVFNKYKPEIVFHAAAHKHVPLMENSPQEAIKNNVFGTYNVARCADENGVRRFVLISTDKAVNPTNIMGASKRLCEMVIQAMDTVSKTEFVAVRFGNVLGSNGSVIPLLKMQIERGGPITITHKEITRFFMTIPEAAQLVLQAGAYAKDGEIFVLDMGKPVKIYDLAKNLARLSGLEIGRDIDVEIIGLRPGEKLYEEMLMAEEGLIKTANKKIYIGKPTFTDIEELKAQLDLLKKVIEEDDNNLIKRTMAKIVKTYKPYLKPCLKTEPSRKFLKIDNEEEAI